MAPAPPEVVAPKAPRSACIDADATGYPELMALEGDRFDFCVYDGEAEDSDFKRCFSLDVPSGAFSLRPAPPGPVETEEAPSRVVGDGFAVDRAAGTVSRCLTAESCVPVDLGGLKPHAYVLPSLSASRRFLAVTAGEGAGETAGDGTWVLIVDATSGKRLAKKKVDYDSYICGGASFVGDTVLIDLNVCAGPGGVAWLANPKTLKKIADLGGKSADFNAYGPTYLPVGGASWAFRSSGGGSLVVQDVVTGKVARSLDLSAMFPEVDGLREVPPDGGDFFALPSGELLVVGADTGLGQFAVVDAAVTRVLRRFSAPRCPPRE